MLASMALSAAEKRESQWNGERLACATCHEDVVKSFRPTAHGKAMEFGSRGHDLTCASCHRGDLAKHMEAADPSLIRNPRKEKPEVGSEACYSCHETEKRLMFWRGSQHESAGVGCLSCHSIHAQSNVNASPEIASRLLPGRAKLLVKRTENETCFSCHGSIRKATLQRSTHLFRDERGTARVECSSCHNPHGTQTEKLISANSINEKCYQCHQEKRGPFLWEHAPVRENCMTCHSPHGSNNEELLAMRRPQLCQSCHIQGRHQTVAGRPNAMWNINRSCQNCHTQVHGSNHPSGPILQR
jgi:DmsE family decaheme c-type cytochrome